MLNNNINKKYKELYNIALKARENSYCPYSKYSVGAAVLCSDGSIYTGCNIENASYSLTNCAERTAIFKAVSDGKRDFRAIAIAGGKKDCEDEFCPPCGACRQVLSEFCNSDFDIILKNKIIKISELLPFAFEI